jgi:hypothetical protein
MKMLERFEEQLGKNPFVTLAQVKDYLSISSNTADARISNIIFYATSVVEHYIGQEVVANDYTEIFNGGVSSVFVSRLPLSNVYQVSEFNGVDYNILNDTTTIGTPVLTTGQAVVFNFFNGAKLTDKIKKFGKSCLYLNGNSFISASEVTEDMQFEQGDFTIEMFIRSDSATLQNSTIFSINTDEDNYLKFKLANQVGLALETSVEGTVETVVGANTDIETQQYQKRKWAHIAVSRELENEKLYLHYNGNKIAEELYSVENHTFTSNIVLGEGFAGYIDELRVSSICRYTDDFTIPTFRFRPDDDTALLVHFDKGHNATSVNDVHSAPSEYSYSRETGRITRDTGGVGVRGTYPTTRNSYPAMTLGGPPSFQGFGSGVKIDYRAGYEPNDVPLDLQVATLDYIKLLYKQDQEKKGFSFEGERGDSFPLAGNFPPHIRRILDFYRIIK